MDNKAHVSFVDAHPERYGGNDHLHRSTNKMQVRTQGCIEAGNSNLADLHLDLLRGPVFMNQSLVGRLHVAVVWLCENIPLL